MAGALSFDVVRRFASGAHIAARSSWTLEEAPVSVLFGPSGSGKTTVLRSLAGLERPDEGAITFRGDTWFDGARGLSVPPQARGVGLLFQEHALFPHLSVSANVGYGLGKLPRPERERRVAELAERFGIGRLLGARPTELSGGQRQRVALARALAPRPRLLLLDEPLSALDAPTREALRGELRQLLEQAEVPAVVVTHDRVEALTLGDRMAVLVDGTIRQVGPVHDVFCTPVDVDVARVVGTENVLLARLVRREDGLAVVRTSGPTATELVAIDPGGIDDEAYACVRAEEVVLEPVNGHASSARNRLPGIISARRDEGPLARITLECGVRLVSLVTRTSADRLGLTTGQRAYAVVKAPAVRIVPRRAR